MAESTPSDFEVLHQLGAGCSGSTFMVKRVVDANIYCLKRISICSLSSKEQTAVIEEAKCLAKLNSPYVIKYYDFFFNSPCLYIVMEYAAQGTLADLLNVCVLLARKFCFVELSILEITTSTFISERKRCLALFFRTSFLASTFDSPVTVLIHPDLFFNLK
jgi:serine/threonine protein kinase